MTPGQIVYEHHYPTAVRVTAWSNRHFGKLEDRVMVPTDNTPWRFLTKKCQESWEVTAKGHFLIPSV